MFNVTEAVTYSRKGKTFEAELDGAKIAEGYSRREAEAALIEAVAPDIASKVDYVRRRCGDKAAKRAHKGAKLLLAEHVEQTETGWLVESETEIGKWYQVTNNGAWYCTCIDFDNGWRGEKFGAPFVEKNGIMCKHCFAVKLSQCRKGNERQTIAASDAPNGSQR